MRVIQLLCVLACITATGVQAATVTFNPNPETVTLGSTFTLDIIGTDFPVTEGGGAEFTFDETILQVNSVSVDSSLWEFFASAGSTDNASGIVEGITVATFVNPGATFTIATIEFLTIGLGSTDLVLSENQLNPWASGGNYINPTFTNGSVTVVSTVPIPAAIWLFGSGLIALVGLARRKVHA